MINVNYIKDLNNNISGIDLEELSNSSKYLDRVFVGKHTNTFNRTLTKLSKDKESQVRLSTLKNSNITDRILRDMYIEEKDEVIKKEIYRLLKGRV